VRFGRLGLKAAGFGLALDGLGFRMSGGPKPSMRLGFGLAWPRAGWLRG